MTTRKILVEQYLRKISGGNISSSFAITELEAGKLIDQVANKRIFIYCVQNGGDWDSVLTTYENVPIVFDEAKKLWYCTIPKVISFKDQQGVYQVSSMQDQENIFIPVYANAQWQYPNINEVLEGSTGYYNEQKRIYLVNYNPSEDTTQLLLKLVVDRSELDEEEDYQIPENLVEDILIGVLNFSK